MIKAIVVILVVIVVGGGYLALHNSSDSSKKNNPGNQTQTSSSAPTNSNSSSNSKPSAATIMYSDSGFSPQTVTVKAGNTIAIKNTSSRDMQFDSDPHPAHTDDEELNVGIVGPGESMTFTVNKTGTHGYHNHLNPGDTGTIIVQ